MSSARSSVLLLIMAVSMGRDSLDGSELANECILIWILTLYVAPSNSSFCLEQVFEYKSRREMGGPNRRISGEVSGHRAKQKGSECLGGGGGGSRIRIRSESIYQILKWTLPNYRSGLNWPATNSPQSYTGLPCSLIQRSVSSVFPWMPLAYSFLHSISPSLFLSLSLSLVSICSLSFPRSYLHQRREFPHFLGPCQTRTSSDSIADLRSIVRRAIDRTTTILRGCCCKKYMQEYHANFSPLGYFFVSFFPACSVCIYIYIYG